MMPETFCRRPRPGRSRLLEQEDIVSPVRFVLHVVVDDLPVVFESRLAAGGEEPAAAIVAALGGDHGVVGAEGAQIIIVRRAGKARRFQQQGRQVVGADRFDLALGDVVVRPEDEGDQVPALLTAGGKSASLASGNGNLATIDFTATGSGTFTIDNIAATVDVFVRIWR